MSSVALYIEVLRNDIEAASFAVVGPFGGAGFFRTCDGFAARRIFPRVDVDDRVSVEPCIFSLHAAGIVTGAPLRVGNAALFEEILHNRIAPHDRVTSLVFETRALIFVELRIDLLLESGPLCR